jgi:hypothetical protein
MMGLSQIDMVSLVNNEQGKLQVCGPLELGRGDSSEDGVIFAVVRQDDLVAVGRGPTNVPRWRIFVDEPAGQAFRRGHAVASVTITLRQENPPGLETLSWVQPVEILPPRQVPAAGPPPVFAGSQVVEPHEGELTGQSIASSLAIRNQPTAEGGPAHTWQHKLELLPIHPTPTDGSTATGLPVA